MGRKLAREESMKLLYQMQMNNDFSDEAVELFLEESILEEDEKEYIEDAIRNIVNSIEDIDNKIEIYAKGWKLNRIAKVDLTILRIAIYEILFRDDIPVEVSINEALEIAKKYSTDESSKFINGLLGSFVRDKETSNG